MSNETEKRIPRDDKKKTTVRNSETWRLRRVGWAAAENTGFQFWVRIKLNS